MAESHWFRRRWKLILNIVTFIALIGVVYALRSQIVGTFKNLAHVHAWALALMIPIELLNYDAQARLYRRLFAIVGSKVPYKHLYRVSLELNFINHVFPSGGVTGLSYFTVTMRNGRELSSGKVTLVHIMKLVLYILSFELLLLFGLFALVLKGRVNNLVIMVISSLFTLLLVGTFSFIYIIGSPTRIDSFFTGATKLLNRLIKTVRPKTPETINILRARGMFNDFHESYMEMKNNLGLLRIPFIYALIADITEIAAIYVVYLAFGELVNIGAVILAYGIANSAGLISVMPGGFGIYEALMTAVLASTGVRAAVSLPVTVMYRVVNTLIQLPPGYLLYNKSLNRTKENGVSGAK